MGSPVMGSLVMGSRVRHELAQHPSEIQIVRSQGSVDTTDRLVSMVMTLTASGDRSTREVLL